MVLALMLTAWTAQAITPVARCSVASDPEARVFELQRLGDGLRWRLVMRDAASGGPVVLPLPDAKPDVGDGRLALEYRTLNGGRTVTWNIAPGGASLDVYVNFELEVNVDADLDPRVERMNTEGPIAKLSCAVPPRE